MKKEEYNKAIPLFEDLIKKQTESLGVSHKHTLLSRNNLAHCYGQVGRSTEALAIFEDVFEKEKVTLGPTNVETLSTMRNVAIFRQSNIATLRMVDKVSN